MEEGKECCCNCEVFKNHQEERFDWGFFCPIKGNFVVRENDACEFALSDGLNF